MEKVTEKVFLEDKLSISEIESVVYLWYTSRTPIIFMTNNGQEIDELIDEDKDFSCDEKVIEKHNLSENDIYYLVNFWYHTIYVDGRKLYISVIDNVNIELNDFCIYKMVQTKLEQGFS
jgi:hypothetical protein